MEQDVQVPCHILKVQNILGVRACVSVYLTASIVFAVLSAALHDELLLQSCV